MCYLFLSAGLAKLCVPATAADYLRSSTMRTLLTLTLTLTLTLIKLKLKLT